MKKAQIKTLETITVIIVFLFLLVFGIIFFSRFYAGNLNAKAWDVLEDRAVKIQRQLSYLPELECTRDQTRKADCFDLVKIEHFQEHFDANKNYYRSVFPNTNVEVHQIYPSLPDDHPNKNGFPILDSGFDQASFSRVFHIPLTLYNPYLQSYHFGYAKIEVLV